MIIIPIGPIVSILGFVWSRKYLRYGVLGSAVVGVAAFMAVMTVNERQAPPITVSNTPVADKPIPAEIWTNLP